ncbi:MAG: hemolysin [Pseudonocardiales bacterium]|nr:hemolysin [Pseudonocardiales bacterium]
MTVEKAEPAPVRLSVTSLSPGLLYDGRREMSYAKPLWRGWMHLLWFAMSLVTGPLLVVSTNGPARLTAAAIYASTVSGLFGTSALYHRGNWSSTWSRRLQRLDHTMIFFLIAGTATPAFLVAAPGGYGLTCLIVLWTLTLTATTVHLAWMHAPEKLVGATFLLLGWMACLALPPIWAHDGVAPAVLIIGGGLLYTIGAISYHRRSPDPNPRVFGYHEVFHAYVCAAATLHFLAIALFILR